MTLDETLFVAACRDIDASRIYADWLEEQGEYGRAAAWRRMADEGLVIISIYDGSFAGCYIVWLGYSYPDKGDITVPGIPGDDDFGRIVINDGYGFGRAKFKTSERAYRYAEKCYTHHLTTMDSSA